MKTIDTYYIKRNNAYIWLSQNDSPLETDEIVEVRPMIFADEGKILVKDGEIIGKGVWDKDNSVYEEIDEPIEESTEEVLTEEEVPE